MFKLCNFLPQKIRGLKFTRFQGEIEQISETEIHCLLLKPKYFSWVRNSLINCQKVGKSFGKAPKRCFVNFHSTPEEPHSAAIGGVMLAETDFWTILE